MAETCRFPDTMTFLNHVVSKFIEDRLINKEKRSQEKQNHTKRLDVVKDENFEKKDTEKRYVDRVVLSSLELGSVAVEEAIIMKTSNMDAKMALLDYAEKKLSVCVKLNSNLTTSGIPNSYLMAWAHLNLSYVWKLRDNVHIAVVHILEMFIVEPFFSRMDFAPRLWKRLFLPHMKSFSGKRVGRLMDEDHHQATKVQETKHNRGELLNENTRFYAKYYRYCLTDDSDTTTKKMIIKPTIFAPRDIPKVLPNKDLPLKEHKGFRKMTALSKSVSGNSYSYSHSGISPSDTDTESTEQISVSVSSVSDEGSQSSIAIPLSDKATPQSKMPKDFICPITGQIFIDPVTLETGQTYERQAIQEWICRGNTTCPITRQPVSAIELPKTNYILKRLITNWETEQFDFPKESSYDVTSQSYISKPNLKPRIFLKDSVSTSQTSLLSQPPSETVIKGLKPYISCLCNSLNLQESESAVVKISAMLSDSDSKDKDGIHSYLSSPTILNGFIKILSTSLKQEVLSITIRILSQMIYIDDSTTKFLNTDFNLSRIATLLKDGLAEVAVLIYLMQLSFTQLMAHDIIPPLTLIISGKNEETNDARFPVEPKDAALALLEKVIVNGDENVRALTANHVISAGAVPVLLKCLQKVDTRQSIVQILLCCIHKNKSSRNLIAHRIELSLILELFHAGNNDARATCVKFLSELVRLSRRTSCNRVLHRIKDEGAFSTMHTLHVHLQMAPMEQKPTIASLLLQLDLLVEPREISAYREEAIEKLIEALQNKNFPASQMAALNALSSLPGHFDAQGKSCLEGWLLKIAGFDPTSTGVPVKKEQKKTFGHDPTQPQTEEEKDAISWEKKVAFVLCNHKKGKILRVLEECLKDDSVKMTRSCLVMATWLIHMHYDAPGIGTKHIAPPKFMLRRFIDVLHSSKSVKDKILATLALRGFLSSSSTDTELAPYAKQIYKTLKRLKLNSSVVNDLLKALINLPSIDVTELWNYTNGSELDATMNGEVLAMVDFRGRLVSSHSDGTIKMWDARKKVVHTIQETREHTKAVTSLCLSSSGGKLFSGSLDKTIRVWTLKNDELYCVEVHDVKEPVVNMSANATAACYLTQGNGVKIYYWTGVPKQVTLNKPIKCINLVNDKLYCGCTNYSIQEVDIATLKSTVFYTGSRKWLGNQTVYTLASQDGVLIAGGTCIDGVAGKVLPLNDGNKEVQQSLSTGHDIQKLNANKYFIFAATKVGVIVWLKERMLRIAYIKLCSSKVTCLASDAQGRMLFTGFTDGKIQVFLTS